ncbi:hypothetical protein P3C58_18975 [Mesorhizobium sp. XAP10]|uniref:hypothetical protein n=1 Tax=unclassified Mesorhizobium TaxID=325217 RepID=UPI0023DFB369|nr:MULTISPECIES: hypothetical protein [unclassified Mesorhizobium]MDF3154065.1 hypothetical protein [Mesorhizobium sp. XAP10]MDF3247166.1 hypothetical protein [Mesorhizobium sp. XAP4]
MVPLDIVEAEPIGFVFSLANQQNDGLACELRPRIIEQDILEHRMVYVVYDRIGGGRTAPYERSHYVEQRQRRTHFFGMAIFQRLTVGLSY